MHIIHSTILQYICWLFLKQECTIRWWKSVTLAQIQIDQFRGKKENEKTIWSFNQCFKLLQLFRGIIQWASNGKGEMCSLVYITFITTFELGINSLLIQILNARKLTISISLVDSVHAILAVLELESMIFESISQRRTPKA